MDIRALCSFAKRCTLICARLRVWELSFGSSPHRIAEGARGTQANKDCIAWCLIDAFLMESRTANLVLRLLQRHLPVPHPAPAFKHGRSHLPGLLPRVPLSFHGPAAAPAAGKRLLDSAVARGGGPPESGVDFTDVERTSFGVFFKQPNSPFLSFDRASDAARAPHPSKGIVAVARGSGVEAPEPVWRFELGLRLKSGMYMPTQHEEESWEASSVKRKRKKKMNKHKQRKLRRRDRHRN